MTSQVRGGLLPYKPDPRIKPIARYMGASGGAVTGAALAPPASIDWYSKITDWPLYNNGVLNDCVPAAFAHAIEQQTFYAGKPVVPTEEDVEAFYAVASADPKWTPGSSDGGIGCVMTTALADWFASGIGGDKPIGYASVNWRDPAEFQQAIALFGSVIVGLALPLTAQTQFGAGTPWDISFTGNSTIGSWFYHCVLVVGYDAATGLYTVVTWGRTQQMTQTFISWYMYEAHTVISRDFIGSNGISPSGLNLGALTVDMMDPIDREVHALYVALYGRAADGFGVSFWQSAVGARDPNYTIEYVWSDLSVADQIWLGQQFVSTQSTYFNARYGALDDQTFVQSLYMNIGGNTGDAGGAAYWVGLLTAAKAAGQSSTDARAGIIGQFAHDMLNIDLTPGAAAFGLSAADYAAAVTRQQQFQNKVAVSQFYTQQSQLPNGGVLAVTSTSDQSFAASQHIVATVTADPATLAAAETAVAVAVAANSLTPILNS